MFKVYGPKNPHDQFQSEWLNADFNQKVATLEEKQKEILDLIKKYFTPNDYMLEAGCGMGRFVKYYHDKGWNIRGVDFAEKAIEKVKEVYPELQVDVGDCTNLPYKTHTFDGYLSFGVIEHMEAGPDAFLKEAYRVLKPTGKALITVPNQENIAYFKIYNKQKIEQNTEFFEYGFTKREFIDALTRNGFKVRKIRYCGYFTPLRTHKILRGKGDYDLNWLGRMCERFARIVNSKKYGWMIGAIVSK